ALLGIDPNAVAPDPRIAATGIAAAPGELEVVERKEEAPERARPEARAGDLFPETLPRRKPGQDNWQLAPDALVTERRAEAAEIEHARYHTISQVASLDDWIAAAMREGLLALGLRTSSDDPMQASITGI